MSKKTALTRLRVLTLAVAALSPCLTVAAVNDMPRALVVQGTPRRPLPKPPKGPRGFEQGAGSAASGRLIAAGATRGPLKPVAPAEGIAYDTHPFFAWVETPGAVSYTFTLREGDGPDSPVIYQTETTATQLRYPQDAPALTPGKIYTWRVSTAGVLERRMGAPAALFILAGEDAAQAAAALKKSKLEAPKTRAERLKQARVFAEYGVWYDALGIARELLSADPQDASAKEFYDALVKRLGEEHAKETSRARDAATPSALELWRQMKSLLISGDEDGARSAAARNPASARLLYRELLFETAVEAMYGNPLLPQSERARRLLAETDAETRALEAKYAEWSKSLKPGVGFTKDGGDVERVIYLAALAKQREDGKESDSDAPEGDARALTEAALREAEDAGLELAAASFSGTLSVYALRERRLNEVRPLLSRPEGIWGRWAHPVGLFQSQLIKAYADLNAEKLKDAEEGLTRAAELAKTLPGLRRARVNTLDTLAGVRRTLGDREGTRAAFAEAVEEQRQFLPETTDPDARLVESKKLANLLVQLGGSLAATSRHVEASEWYARAEQLKRENYRVESAKLEGEVARYNEIFRAKAREAKDEETRKTYLKMRETIVDALLSQIDTLAAGARDWAKVARVAELRVKGARENGDPANIADALTHAADAYRKSGDYAKARAFASEALALREADPRRRSLYESHYLLANVAYDADDRGEAVKQYRRVVELTRPGALPPPYDLEAETDKDIRRIRARMNATERVAREGRALDARTAVAHVLSQQGNYREASEELSTVEHEIPRLYAAGAPDEAELLRWLEAKGDAEIKETDVEAEREARGFNPDADERQRFELAAMTAAVQRAAIVNYRAMMLEEQNDLDAAEAAYKKSFALNANLVGGAFTLTGTYVALARIARERGDYAAAEAPLAAALAEFQRRDEPWGVAQMLAFQSTLRREQGRLDEARRLAEDALKITRNLNSRTQTAAALRTLGRAESEQGGDSLKSAEAHLRESLAVWRELGLRAHVAYTLGSLGQTLERMGRDDEALKSYVEAVGIVETLVGSLSKDASAETFNASRGNRELYDRLVKLLIRKGRASEALQYLERAKSKVLVDALAGANVNAKDPALNALLERVRVSAEKTRAAEKALAEELAKEESDRDAGRVEGLRAEVAGARGEYAEVVERIKRANPSYASLVAVNPTDLAAVSARLPEKTVLLEYFPTERELYVFVVRRGQEPSIKTVAVGRAALAQLVREYREALTDPEAWADFKPSTRVVKTGGASHAGSAPTIAETTVKLYDALLAPAREEIDEAETVLLVPAAELYYLPIHALARAGADGSLRFLIEEKRFAYLASADLLNVVTSVADAARASKREATRPLLALGNPDGSLPAADEEVNALSRVLRGGAVYTGGDATAARITDPSARASYLHLATHGHLNSLDPKESYLMLAGEPSRLTVKDIVEDRYRLSLEGTRLVTLSACETSLGGFDPSAVYSSLSRAFSKAGAPSVVASLWSVSDASTRDTMTAFYRELAAGRPRAEALRRAQLAVMRDPRYAHPFFWAPFVILGDWR